MNPIEYIREGFQSTLMSRSIILWLYLANLTLALVPTILLTEEIESSLVESQMAEKMSEGYSEIWFAEFKAEAKGLSATLDPTVTGIGGILNSYDDLFGGNLLLNHIPLIALACLYVVLWTFSSGGLLKAFIRNRAPSLPTFLSDSGTYFPRFLKITLLALIAYGVIFAFMKPAIDNLLDYLLREEVDERIVFTWTLGKYLFIATTLALINMLSDYTKISTVLENRQSVVLAFLRSLRLCLTQPVKTIGLYFALTVLGLLLFLCYWAIVPGASQQGWTGVIIALMLGQLYIVSRVWLRALYLGSQSRLYRDLR